MQFALALLVWLLISFVLGLGIWLLTVKGIFWFLAVATIAFCVAVWQLGCKAH